MATSISKAQADLLAKGFLDTIGSSKEAIVPLRSLSSLYQLCGKLVETAQDNLNKVDRVSSGALSESMKIENPEKKGSIIAIDVTLLYYYKFIDQGVKGVNNKSISSPYSFKNLFVSDKMLKSIHRWVKKEGKKAKTETGGKPITKRERKRKGITDTSKSTAYVIARSVKSKGLKRTLFWTKAVKEVDRIAEQELGQAFLIDVINSLPKTL